MPTASPPASARIRIPRKLSKITGTTTISASVRRSAIICWITRRARIKVRLVLIGADPFLLGEHQERLFDGGAARLLAQRRGGAFSDELAAPHEP